MLPLRLSDDEIDAVLAACRPIAPPNRDAFLLALARALSAAGELGPGVTYRVIREVQRQYFDPPDLRTGIPAKYS